MVAITTRTCSIESLRTTHLNRPVPFHIKLQCTAGGEETCVKLCKLHPAENFIR